MDEPGGLRDLGRAGRAAWRDAVASCVKAAMPEEHPCLLPVADSRTPHVTGPDWVGLPARVVTCVGRARVLRLLDRHRSLQEEYLEWRTVRARGGAITRVELTTELRDYWRVLAACEPERTIELVGELTGTAVSPRQVYGIADPLAADPGEREASFAKKMIDAPNRLNDGRAGICFMSHRDNDLAALVKIAAKSATPCVLRDALTGRSRCATAARRSRCSSGQRWTGGRVTR